MDYFLVLFLFVSTEDIIVNVDAENIVGIIQNIVGIIYSKRSQKWLFLSLQTGEARNGFFYRLTLGTIHVSYLIEAKHQTC